MKVDEGTAHPYEKHRMDKNMSLGIKCSQPVSWSTEFSSILVEFDLANVERCGF